MEERVLTEWKWRDGTFCSKDSDPWCLFQTSHSHQNSRTAVSAFSFFCLQIDLPKGGLEPPRVTSHAPQTCASTNSATSSRPGRLFDVRRALACRVRVTN